MNNGIKDREYDKFRDAENNLSKVAVTIEQEVTNPIPVFNVGNIVPPIDTDAITVEYPTTVKEIYKFRSGGVTGTVLKIIEVSYEDSTKERLTTVIIDAV